ncbi:MAG: DapH/DapD/GlmU-related protein [Chloroflexaceae bacterium]
MNPVRSQSRRTLAWTVEAMRQDLRRYSRDAPLPVVLLRSVYLHPSLAGILYYRIGHWLWLNRRNPLVLPVFLCYLALYPLVRMYSGLELLPQTTVGPGLQVLHFGPTVIHYRAIIGSNATLLQGVTIGVSVIGISNTGAPRIGDNVSIGVRAAILGDITIGDNVTIGANAVVTRPVPADTTVVGIPAKPVFARQPVQR